jgi:hypothetical protein
MCVGLDEKTEERARRGEDLCVARFVGVRLALHRWKVMWYSWISHSHSYLASRASYESLFSLSSAGAFCDLRSLGSVALSPRSVF